MAKIAEIVSYINTTLKAGTLSASRFQKGNWQALVEILATDKNGETNPAIVANNGQSTKVVINDTYPFQVYHRITSSNFYSPEDYGYNTRVETYNIQMVIIGNREALQVTKEQIMTALSMGFPLEIPKATLTSLGLEQVDINITGYDLDRESVYRREYGNTPFLLKPQNILISLQYSIETYAKAGCIEIC